MNSITASEKKEKNTCKDVEINALLNEKGQDKIVFIIRKR